MELFPALSWDIYYIVGCVSGKLYREISNVFFLDQQFLWKPCTLLFLILVLISLLVDDLMVLNPRSELSWLWWNFDHAKALQSDYRGTYRKQTTNITRHIMALVSRDPSWRASWPLNQSCLVFLNLLENLMIQLTIDYLINSTEKNIFYCIGL